MPAPSAGRVGRLGPFPGVPVPKPGSTHNPSPTPAQGAWESGFRPCISSQWPPQSWPHPEVQDTPLVHTAHQVLCPSRDTEDRAVCQLLEIREQSEGPLLKGENGKGVADPAQKGWGGAPAKPTLGSAGAAPGPGDRSLTTVSLHITSYHRSLNFKIFELI